MLRRRKLGLDEGGELSGLDERHHGVPAVGGWHHRLHRRLPPAGFGHVSHGGRAGRVGRLGRAGDERLVRVRVRVRVTVS